MKYFYKNNNDFVFVKTEYRSFGDAEYIDLCKIENMRELFNEINSEELGIAGITWLGSLNAERSIVVCCYSRQTITIQMSGLADLDDIRIQEFFEELLKTPKINLKQFSSLFKLMRVYNKFPDDLKLLIEARQ